MTVTVLRANIMLVVAYRRAALELIQIKHFQFKYKRVPLELYIIYCNLVLSLTVLYRNLQYWLTVLMHAFRISAQHISPAHTQRTVERSGMYETGGRHRVGVTPHPIALKHIVGQL